ncbi:MAG: HNH endonuclease family protein [Nocardioides sp.]|uniref:HNH endonuclease family protein n=1 Tax=Nocardioides sp. TaxID=35761 RepID=UPI003263571B
MRALTRHLLALAASVLCCTATATPAQAADDSRVDRLLSIVQVVASEPYHPGYDRDCDPGACVFGEPWTDEHDGPFAGNGCTTREDVLLQQMRDIELRWGSRCRIYDARLTDPYTGRRMTWQADGYEIVIDHVYPLAEAWHGGAWSWTQRRRTAFANDVRHELLAVSASANDAKEASSPAEWLPPRRRYHCTYVRKYLRVAVAWDLPITSADEATISSLGC